VYDSRKNCKLFKGGEYVHIPPVSRIFDIENFDPNAIYETGGCSVTSLMGDAWGYKIPSMAPNES